VVPRADIGTDWSEVFFDDGGEPVRVRVPEPTGVPDAPHSPSRAAIGYHDAFRISDLEDCRS